MAFWLCFLRQNSVCEVSFITIIKFVYSARPWNYVTCLVMWLWMLQNAIWKVSITAVLLSFTNICLSSQGKNKHFCVKQDKVALNPRVKNKNCFLKIKLKVISHLQKQKKNHFFFCLTILTPNILVTNVSEKKVLKYPKALVLLRKF